MMPIIRPEPGQDIGELARQLLAIAEAEGLEQPVTDTSGPSLAFSVSDELFASFEGAPSEKAKRTQEPHNDSSEDSGDEEEPDGGKRRGRRKKGDN